MAATSTSLPTAILVSPMVHPENICPIVWPPKPSSSSRAHQEQPFLAYFAFYSVHTPLMAREDLHSNTKPSENSWA